MTGIILLNKPQGITSFTAVAKIRRITGEKKAGHTGTLDPMATGVLPILLGGATRFCDFLPSDKKEYRAVIKLGQRTDTMDITGKTVSECDVGDAFANLDKTLKSFVGDISQLPPMYSAISKNGVRLYTLARQGIEVERELRNVSIYYINIININTINNEFEILVGCSAGTYIRTLADDIGNALGCGAVLTELQRTFSNGFHIDRCNTFDELEDYKNENELSDILIPVHEALAEYDKIYVTEAQSRRFMNGGELSFDRLNHSFTDKMLSVYSDKDVFLGLGEPDCINRYLRVKRVFLEK